MSLSELMEDFSRKVAMQHIQPVASGDTICVMITILRSVQCLRMLAKSLIVGIFTD